ncbi:cellulose biosynthesis cyclic di-GMP-binding regulatory protein BcsB [Paenibacillus albicereus]|uniref:Cellulose biosynthesis cyclic di-GMP-binding regulatory protein BcsB n=1 Tax=Paenibacillus albicereus TaxID=2726185 RepID=A0A6H2GX28_9BACL|nr:cellulose biosynthesis cyclic di-GMP-binding regulatory protein BcsB [Paenibacillus albicereus]QJC51970.1 cellulose biosynthesis cyclic di-GMP-binding regulatory protein BcsB [Paenibacillus albicereus]
MKKSIVAAAALLSLLTAPLAASVEAAAPPSAPSAPLTAAEPPAPASSAAPIGTSAPAVSAAPDRSPMPEERLQPAVGRTADGASRIRLPYGKDVKLQGYYSAQSAYFTLGRHWQLRAGVLHLELRSSRLSANSALTIEVNGKPVRSMRLSDIGESGRSLDVAVPAGDLAAGVNEIRLSLGHADDRFEICADDRSDENWLLVGEGSYLQAEYKELPATGELRQFPYPFVPDAGERSGEGTTIVLPDGASPAVAAAGLQTAAALGLTAEEGLPGLYMAGYSEVAAGKHRSDHLLYVGPASAMPQALKAAAPSDALSRLDQGALLFRAASPLQDGRLLMGIVSGEDESVLDAAARLLQNPELVAQLDGSAVLLPSGTNVNRPAADSSRDRWSLEELGYSQGLQVKGPFRQQADFDVKLPANKLVLPGAKARFELKYAKNLNVDQSLATLYVNGIPAGSKKLDAESADGDVWEVQIPSGAARSGYLAMSVAFDLQMTGYDCIRPGEQTPWAYIAPESTVSLPAEDERAMLLEHYPWPFIKNGRWNAAAFVLPPAGDSTDLSREARIAARLGSYLTDNSGSLQARSDAPWEADSFKGLQLIAVGTPQDSELIRSVAPQLWFPYDSGLSRFVGNEKRRLLPDFAARLASIQLLPAPEGGGSLLAVTAPQEESLQQAENYLSTRSYGSGLVGNATLVDRWEKAMNHYFADEGSTGMAERVSLSSGEARLFAILFGTVLLLLLLGIILIWRKYRKNR